MIITVKVTKRGRIMIPIEIRKRFGIKEGDELLVEVTKEGILLKVIPKIKELAGVDSEFGSVEEVKREIENIREEY